MVHRGACLSRERAFAGAVFVPAKKKKRNSLLSRGAAEQKAAECETTIESRCEKKSRRGAGRAIGRAAFAGDTIAGRAPEMAGKEAATLTLRPATERPSIRAPPVCVSCLTAGLRVSQGQNPAKIGRAHEADGAHLGPGGHL